MVSKSALNVLRNFYGGSTGPARVPSITTRITESIYELLGVVVPVKPQGFLLLERSCKQTVIRVSIALLYPLKEINGQLGSFNEQRVSTRFPQQPLLDALG